MHGNVVFRRSNASDWVKPTPPRNLAAEYRIVFLEPTLPDLKLIRNDAYCLFDHDLGNRTGTEEIAGQIDAGGAFPHASSENVSIFAACATPALPDQQVDAAKSFCHRTGPYVLHPLHRWNSLAQP